ncbi:MAG: nucleotidyl transferase AbiEii/AbiGii toxin family protein [Thermofilaceae archaeon]
MLRSIVEREAAKGVEPTRVLRELLHKLVIYALAQLGLYERYTLQGGAALRLFYGSPRFSLDLGFTLSGPINDSLSHAGRLGRVLSRVLAPDGIGVSVSSQRLDEAGGFHRYFLTFGAEGLVGRRIRVKVEVFSRSYHTPFFEVRALTVVYPVQTAVGIRVKKAGCILADKVCSLAGAWRRGFVRWRDIFDVYWLVKHCGAQLDESYLKEEFGTYLERPHDLIELTAHLKAGGGLLEAAEKELSRLLNPSLLQRELLERYLEAAIAVLEEAVRVVV